MDTPRTRSQRNAPTINDVARHAGVSPMTVSRVINGEAVVRSATRDKVKASIAALNYAPSAAARQLAGGEEARIALVYANPSAAFLSELLMGCLDQASSLNVQLMVEKCAPDMSVPALMDHLRRGRVNGIILPTPLSQSEELLAALRAESIPVVTVAATRNRPDAYSVSIDDYQAARAMTAYLIEMGHRRIGFIKGNPDHGSAERRYLGYLAALDEAGIELDLALVGQGLYTYRSGLMAADAMLTIANRPTAIFASNDDMAAATIATAHMMRLHVPGDLTVCGCDDTPLATTIWPELTTIRLPISDMARAGVNMLAEAIRSRKKPAPVKHELFDYTLVRRQSDAPPSAVSQISR